MRTSRSSRTLRKRYFGTLMVAVALALTSMLMLVNVDAAASFATPAFQAQWQAGEAITPNFWGPLATAHDGQPEPYVEAPSGTRLVQYFDKARMELTNPGNGIVTNGLLATELITGMRQLGDNTFENNGPANVPVAGDPDNIGPTYAAIQANAASLRNATASGIGANVTTALTPNGQFTAFANGASFAQANIAGYDSDTHHNVPAAFLNYRTKAGLLTIGLAISEPFWANVKVGGQPKDVLIQAFERRVLTYTPSNPDAFQVEFGNIGNHYYQWRYVTAPSGSGSGGTSATAVSTTPSGTTGTSTATTAPTASATATATMMATATATATTTPTPTATTAPVPPTVSGLSVTNVTATKATITYTTSTPTCGTAELRVKGDTSWSTNIDSITCSPLTMSVTATLTSLNPNTMYEVRGAAKDAKGTIGYSAIASFTTLTAQPTADSYDGNWIADDPNSGTVARLYITTANTMVSVHGYGQCSGGDCDWGSQTVAFAGDPVKVTYVFANGAPTINLSISFTDDTRTHLQVVFSDPAAGTHTVTLHRKPIFISPIFPVTIKI